jgi:hypothetical protein
MDENEAVEPMRIAIMEILMVLHKHGIKEAHIGAIMRLVGVEEKDAQECDNERIYLTDDFTEYVNQMLKLTTVSNINQTLH